MRLAVVVAILVVVCVLDNAAAIRSSSSANKSFSCTGYKDVPCGRGWSRFGGWRCANFYSAAKTYDDAEAYCRTQGAHLVSVHDFADMHNTLCLSKRGNPAVQKVWVGAKKVVGKLFTNIDGSRLFYGGSVSAPRTFHGRQNCVVLSNKGTWIGEECTMKRPFLCVR